MLDKEKRGLFLENLSLFDLGYFGRVTTCVLMLWHVPYVHSAQCTRDRWLARSQTHRCIAMETVPPLLAVPRCAALEAG